MSSISVTPILLTTGIMTGIGLLSALILYVVSKKFQIVENPRIGEVETMLPGANCGACGFAGCKNLAEACVKAEKMDGLYCPVGKDAAMKKIAAFLGKTVESGEEKVAVLRCNGNCNARCKTTQYEGTRSGAIMTVLYSGETECPYGCLACGDCVEACQFDAIQLCPETGIPQVDEAKCTACGACTKACMHRLLELRKRGPKNRRVYVACSSHDKGGGALKACKNACIGCGKCLSVCNFGAITLDHNLSYVNADLCRLCRKCEAACPTGAIHAVNFPVKPAPSHENV